MAKEVTLKKGLTFTYKEKRYMNGMSYTVDNETASYLESLGRFTVKGTEAKDGSKELSKKVRIRKPDTSKVGEVDGAQEGVPVFRSKNQLAKYAEEEHGLKFDGDLKELKMDAMREELESHINTNSKPDAKEPAIEV